ncbi:PQ loop repeat-containing protein 2 [Balamuthia mandrillaris]
MTKCVCDPLSKHGHSYVQWIGTAFHTCAYTPVDVTAFILGLLNIALWCCAQAPQVYFLLSLVLSSSFSLLSFSASRSLLCSLVLLFSRSLHLFSTSHSLAFSPLFFLLMATLQKNKTKVYTNWKQGEAEALSATFLVIWLLGDITNLLGTILTQQLPVQLYTAIYFCLMDVVLLGQYCYYRFKNRHRTKVIDERSFTHDSKKGFNDDEGVSKEDTEDEDDDKADEAKEGAETQRQPLMIQSNNKSGFESDYSGSESEGSLKMRDVFYQNSFASPSPSPTAIMKYKQLYVVLLFSFFVTSYTVGGGNISIGGGNGVAPLSSSVPHSSLSSSAFSQVFLDTTSVPSSSFSSWSEYETTGRVLLSLSHEERDNKAPNCEVTATLSQPIEIIGDICAWVSGLLYLWSRIPQVLLNHRRKSVEGLSFFMFFCSTMANICYGLAVLMPGPTLNSHFYRATLAYLVGSVLVLVPSLVILYQFGIYKWVPYFKERRKRQKLLRAPTFSEA